MVAPGGALYAWQPSFFAAPGAPQSVCLKSLPGVARIQATKSGDATVLSNPRTDQALKPATVINVAPACSSVVLISDTVRPGHLFLQPAPRAPHACGMLPSSPSLALQLR